MIRVSVVTPERSPSPTGPVEFDVAPRVGESIFLRIGTGKGRWYRVANAYHASRTPAVGGGVGYSIELEWDDTTPPRWHAPDDYRNVDLPEDDE